MIGVGSIGARHAANLRALGADVVTVDTHLEADYPSFAAAPDVDAAVIATPADSHIDLAIAALLRGCDVFIEKPLATSRHDLHPLDAVREAGQILQVGYNLRFRPELQQLRAKLLVDRPVLVRMEFSQRLSEWRPGRDYRDTPTARPHHQGGGILLEASHELDLMLWMFGPPGSLYGVVRTLSSLAPTFDHVNVLVDYGDLLVDVSLDMITAGYRRSIHAVHMDGEVTEWSYVDDLGASYVAEMRHFMECVERRTAPSVGVREGLEVLKLVDVILATNDRGVSARDPGVAWRVPLWRRPPVAN